MKYTKLSQLTGLHQSTQFTLYIYIKVLLILSSYVGGYAGVAPSVWHLGVLDLNNTTVGCNGHMVVRPQDLRRREEASEERINSNP